MKTRLIHGVALLLLIVIKAAPAQQPAPPQGAPMAQEGRPLDQRAAPAPTAPFTLTKEQQEYVDQVLDVWESHTAKIKTFRCEFTRWTFDPAFDKVDPATRQGIPGMQCDGEIKYGTPDKGTFKVNEIRRLNIETGKYEAGKDEIGEHWVSTGDAVYEYDTKQKQVIKRPIPPEMRGRAISDGPLPFLFGAEAEKLKRRYFLRIVTPQEFAETEIWVDAFPRFRGDAANFKRSILRLRRDSFEPFALRLYDPAGGYSSYEFRSIKVNDSVLDKILDVFKPPLVPRGWRMVVEDHSTPPPAPPQPTANRPPLGSARQ